MAHLALHMPRRKARYIIGALLFMLIAALITARLYLDTWARDYVNRVLADIPGYEGHVEDVDIALYRGAYKMHGLKVFKKTGDIPVPFIDIKTVDFSIEWNALFRGRIASNVDVTAPVLNFAEGRQGTMQTGRGVDWSDKIKELMPIDINLVKFRDGKLTYQDFSTTPKVNIYIRNILGELRNLRNVADTSNPLPSTIQIAGDSIGGGRLNANGRLNILKAFPDMELDVKLESVDLRALSDYTRAYAAVDIERGDLNVYSEVSVKNGRVYGYIKPIATNIAIIDLRNTNPIKLAWEVIVGTVVEVFSNQRRDQFATKVPLEGDLNNVETNGFAAFVGIVRNAFIEALKRGFG